MNKYSIFALSVILVILCISLFDVDPNEEEYVIGYADDISSSENGYVFYIINDDGDRIKAFYSEKIDDDLYFFSGSFSDDRTIFFVKNAKEY